MKKILIIEDDKVLRENTAEFLKEEGYEVITAEDGSIGVQMTMKHLPDLIVCDIIMPNVNGYDFYKTIRQIKSTSTIPLIFLTAKIEKEDIREGMQLGADDYITKPFDYNDLLNAIATRFAKYETLQKMHEEKFYSLIDNPLMGVFIYKNGKFDFVNTACAKIFGLYENDFSNLSFADIINDESKTVLEKIERCINGHQNAVNITSKAFHKDKINLVVEISASLVSYKGAPALIGNIVDCTHLYKDRNTFFTEENKNTANFSKREIEVFVMICQGKSTPEIAKALEISNRTVDTHRANLLNKTGTKNTAELVMYGVRNHLIPL